MTNYGEHWTDEDPEVGKRYWFTFYSPTLGRWYAPYQERRHANETWTADGCHLRSAQELPPDPVPPPLPEVKP